MRSFFTGVALLALLGLVGTSGFTIPLAIVLLTYGCGQHEALVTKGLTRHHIFDTRPPGAQPDGEPSEYCEEDDKIVAVTRGYRLSGADERVLGFYRDAATRAGWRPGTEDEDSICFVRVIADRDVTLGVWLGDADDTYVVSLDTAPRNSGHGCSEE